MALSIVFILVTLALYCYSCFSAGLNDMVNPGRDHARGTARVPGSHHHRRPSFRHRHRRHEPSERGQRAGHVRPRHRSRRRRRHPHARQDRHHHPGNRQAAEFIPVDGVDPAELADAAQLSSLADETPEGRSIVVLAKEQFGLRGRTLEDKGMEFIPFTAATRMSGVNYEGNEIRKGAADSVRTYVEAAGGVFSQECDEAVERIAKAGGTPLVVTKNCRVLGVVYLKDIIKSGVKEKFADLRKMGIKTIMVTGDNPLTAAAIAAEAGVDDFLAEATPEGKLEKIREFQREGHLVASR